MKKAVSTIFMALFISGILFGIGRQEPSKSVKIGLAVPLTGASAEVGRFIQNGVVLAVERFNEAGGYNGSPVTLVILDDKGDPKEAALVANNFADNKAVVAVVGHWLSSSTLAAAPIYNRAGLVEIAPAASAASVTHAGDYTFRTITTDDFQGDYLAKWAFGELGYKKIAIMYESSDFGKGLADVFSAQARSYGRDVLVNESYLSGETKDFSAILSKIKNSGADSIFIGGQYTDAALIAKQARRFDIQLPFLGVDALYTDGFIELGGDAVEGIRLVGFFHENSHNTVAQDFVTAYRKAYSRTPDTYAAYSYDAALIILDALNHAGPDRKAIRDYIAKLKNFPGATGLNTFDENGDVSKEPLRLIVKNGNFTIIN
jgi:branched-chain amino acid transport system substrate-binding protein